MRRLPLLFAVVASALLGAAVRVNGAAGPLPLLTWLELEKQNVAGSVDPAVLNLPADQDEVAYLLSQRITYTSAYGTLAFGTCDLAHLQIITNPQAKQILQRPPFPPTDPSFFSEQTYGVPTSPPAAARDESNLQLRGEMLVTFAKRFHGNVAQIAQALALFDDSKLIQYVPDPRLRAGVSLLKGTVGEGAIDAYRNGVFTKVVFVSPPANGTEADPSLGAIAQVARVTGDSGPTVFIQPAYQYEDPKLLATVLAHEALHEDPPDGGPEELTNYVIETLSYAQFVNEDPGLARTITGLVRRDNTRLMALINTRDTQGNIHILSSAYPNVYPGSLSIPLPYFAYGVLANSSFYIYTPGNSTLDWDLSRIAKKSISGANFDDKTLNLLDADVFGVFTPSQWVRLALILKLNLNSEVPSSRPN